MTELEKLLWMMADYPEYEAILETPGFAVLFNTFVKTALEFEEMCDED